MLYIKRSLIVLLSVFLLTVGLSACAKSHTIESESDSETEVVSKEAAAFSFDMFDEFNNKVYPLDVSYRKEMSEAHEKSRYETEVVREKFISVWESYVQYYYSTLIGIDDEKEFADKDGKLSDDIADLLSLFDGWKDALIEDQKNWKENTDVQIATMQKLMNRIYTGGSATGSGVSSYKYSLYRQRALHLYNLCTLLFADCGEPDYLRDLTEEEAKEIVLKKIGDNNGSRIVEVEQSRKFNGTDYYFLHAYSLGPVQTDENGQDFQQTYTFNWFYVDKRIGKIYVEETTPQSSALALYK
ncbi:MAG: hypothetical protein J5662_08525 [Clostridia bacterium]|nr:hypothetical protein [Clostridia bacterium]